ncbi:MAG: hypothetical protein NWQ27_05860 [Crocinitomicaceae bacterium]|nr:hypothetical protein [Crocinitomicaceae bacterium]
MKKAYILLFAALFTLVGCKLIAKEIKKSNQIRRAAKEVCDCKYVGVSTSYSNGNGTLTLTIRRTNSQDYSVIADSIMSNLKAKYEKTCGFGEIFILFETDSLTEKFTYYGCDPIPDHESFDPNEIIQDEWDSWGEEEDSLSTS